MSTNETDLILAAGAVEYAEIAELVRKFEKAWVKYSKASDIEARIQLAGVHRELKVAQASARDAFARKAGWHVGAPFSIARLRVNARGRAQESALDFPSVDDYLWAGCEPAAIVAHTDIDWETCCEWAQLEDLRIEALAGSWHSPTEHIGILLMRNGYRWTAP